MQAKKCFFFKRFVYLPSWLNSIAPALISILRETYKIWGTLQVCTLSGSVESLPAAFYLLKCKEALRWYRRKLWCAGPYLPRTFPEESHTKEPSRWATASYFRVNSNLFYGADGGWSRERRAERYRGIISFIHLRDLRILRIKYADRVFKRGHVVLQGLRPFSGNYAG